MKRKELTMNMERLLNVLEEPLRRASKTKFGYGLAITYTEYKLFEQIVESVRNLANTCKLIQTIKNEGKPF